MSWWPGSLWSFLSAKIVGANAVEVDARHRENCVEIVQHGGIFQQSAYQHLFVCLTVVRRLVGNPAL
jgi:hypothetical protein